MGVCGIYLDLLAVELEVGLEKLNEFHSTIPLRCECGLNLELLVGGGNGGAEEAV